MLFSFAFLMTSVCLAKGAYNEDYYKVGTVLYTKDAVNKQRWSLRDILILQARLNFLEVIPPPEMLNIQDKSFTNSFLTYFKDAIKTVKNEVADPEMRGILITALSDTIGGYMKMWILPIVKYAYYGGTVPQNDALELFDFHDELKKFLKTDGAGWQSPSPEYLNSIAINITPINIKTTYIRSAPLGCEALSYYEKTNDGLVIPMPNINWNKDTESMFIPLKNGTLVSLNSRNHSDSLLDFYMNARSCAGASQMDNKIFEERLQAWLLQDIIPHLNDEKLYPALKSVLMLVNRTRNLCDTVIDLYSMKKASQGLQKFRTRIASILPIDLSSKKMMVITIIIFLEIVWCIPTLCYLVCTKIRKKSRYSKRNNVYYFIDPKQKKAYASGSTQCSALSDITIAKEVPKTTSKGLTAKHSTKSACLGESGTNNFEDPNALKIMPGASGHSIGTCTRSNFTCQLNRMEVGTSLRQIHHIPSKRTVSSLKNIPDNKGNRNSSIMSLATNFTSAFQDKDVASKTESFITVQELQPTKTVTLLRDNLVRVRSGNVEFVNEVMKVDGRNTEIAKKESSSSSKQPTTSRKKRHSDVHTTKSSKLMKDRYSVHNRTTSAPHTKADEKPKKSKEKKGPVLEITIDNPRDICVDIDGVRVNKPSKIPKRNSHVTQTSWVRTKKERPGKTCIPHLKRKVTLDDMAVKSKKTSAEKLNDTL